MAAAVTDIDFVVDVPGTPVILACDRRLMGQALTNLVKNATEAIAAMRERMGRERADEGGVEGTAAADYRGQIEASLTVADGQVTVSVIDNGCGLPKKDRGRLVEPYMTTRAKGTGIGLAVVHKVTEQHGGKLRLEDAPPAPGRSQGAAIRMILPLAEPRGAAVGTDKGEAAAE